MQAASAMAVVKKVLLGRRKVRGASFPSSLSVKKNYISESFPVFVRVSR